MKDALGLLSAGRPFFPPELNAMQVGTESVMRHLWLTGAVSLEAKKKTRLRILEVGSWMGASMLTWAFSLDRYMPEGGEIFCVDTWRPYLAEAETAAQGHYRVMDRAASIGLTYEIFCHNASCVPDKVRVNHLRGLSKDMLPLLRDASFDIVYIDGSHHYPDVVTDLAEGRRLVREGGLLCEDDLERERGDVDESVLRSNLERDTAIDPASGRVFHPGVTLAVAEMIGRVSAYTGFWVVRREGTRFAPVDLSGGEVVIPDHFTGSAREMLVQWMHSSGLITNIKQA